MGTKTLSWEGQSAYIPSNPQQWCSHYLKLLSDLEGMTVLGQTQTMEDVQVRLRLLIYFVLKCPAVFISPNPMHSHAAGRRVSQR